MPYPVDIDTTATADFAFTTFNTERVLGPYQFTNKLYLFQLYGDGELFESYLRCYLSTDEGMTWNIAGEEEDKPLPPRTHKYQTFPIATTQSGDSVVIAFVAHQGDWDTEDVTTHVAFAEFDMTTETWGERFVGPRIYVTGELATSFFSPGIVGAWEQCTPSVVKRSTGEVVIMIDDHDATAEISFETRYFRQLSLYTYNGGTWTTHSEPFEWEPSGDRHRENMAGNLVLDSDDTVFMFASSVSWTAGYPHSSGLHDVRAEFMTFNPDNTFGTQQTLSSDLEKVYQFHVMPEAVMVGGHLYVAYRKTDQTFGVTRIATGTEIVDAEVVVTPAIDTDNWGSVNAALVVSGDKPHLMYADVADGSYQILTTSRNNDGTWTTPTAVFNLGASDTTIMCFNARALADNKVGMSSFLFGYSDAPFVYYQVTLTGGGPTVSCRYYAL